MAVTRSEILLKTQQVARAFRVSVSTIKRWVDAGDLRAAKTVGRHRLIPLSEAIAFARRQALPCPDLERLVDGGTGQIEEIDDRAREMLEEALRDGREQEAKALIRSAYARASCLGSGAAILGDLLIQPVMERIGHGWQSGELDVYQEHRASQVVGAVLIELIALLPDPEGRVRPVALGASPEGDHSTIPGLLCELLLRERGWRVTNLGPNLPLPSLVRAVRDHAPGLVWLSIGHLADPARFLPRYENFYERAVAAGAAVVLGGRALGPELRARLVATSFGDRLAHLAEFALRLHPTAEALPEQGRESRLTRNAPQTSQ